jgi:hypothetical protein
MVSKVLFQPVFGVGVPAPIRARRACRGGSCPKQIMNIPPAPFLFYLFLIALQETLNKTPTNGIFN